MDQVDKTIKRVSEMEAIMDQLCYAREVYSVSGAECAGTYSYHTLPVPSEPLAFERS